MKKKSKRIIVFTILMMIIFIVGDKYTAVFATSNTKANFGDAITMQTDFKVKFSGIPKVSNKDKVKAAVTNDISATINVTGLTMEENVETASYIVQNTSKDLLAELSVNITNSNEEYFLIEPQIEKTTLINGEATRVIIKVELLKEPEGESEKSTIGIQLKAKPIQPTEDDKNDSETGSNSKPENDDSSTSTSPSTNINPKPDNKPQYDYYEKDETPKTGNAKFINIFWR